MQSQSTRDLQAMFDEGPQRLDCYLRQFEDGTPVEYAGFVGIHEGGEFRAIPSSNMPFIYERAAYYSVSEDSLEWARIAVRAAKMWALAGDSWSRRNAMQRAMQFRATLICKWGSRSGHPVLDKESILSWFSEEQTLPIDVVMVKAARWRETELPLKSRLTLGELRDLRDLKIRLGVVKALADCGEVSVDSFLNEWLKIRAQLP